MKKSFLYLTLVVLIVLLIFAVGLLHQPSEPVPPVLETPAEETVPPEPVSIPEEPLEPEVFEIQIVKPEPEPEPQPTEADLQTQALQTLADQFCAEQSGKWDIWIESLDSGAAASARLGVAKAETMVSASIIKIFVMATVYDRIEQGILDHDAVYDTIWYMITVSDNDSTNQLIRLLGDGDAAAGMKAVNAYAESLGCTDVHLNRLMLEDNGLQNEVTASDCARVLAMIYRGECVSEVWSAEMLEILAAQTVRNRIPAGLPAGVRCANKTGDLTHLCCADVGIVFTDTADYILCAICNDPVSDSDAAAAIQTLSAQVYAVITE